MAANGSYRPTLPGSSAHTRTFGLTIQAPDNGHSLSAIVLIFPSPTGHFANEQSGTDFGRRGAADGSRRDRPDCCPAPRSQSRKPTQHTATRIILTAAGVRPSHRRLQGHGVVRPPSRQADSPADRTGRGRAVPRRAPCTIRVVRDAAAHEDQNCACAG